MNKEDTIIRGGKTDLVNWTDPYNPIKKRTVAD